MLAFTADNKWQLGIGDPTVMGWVTVVAYLVAALLCGQCAARERRAASRRKFVFWGIVTTLLFLLGINKQLDLQTWFTLFAKGLAQEQGWYEHRQIIQVAFVFMIAAVGVCFASAGAWLVRGEGSHQWSAYLGLLFLGSFVLIRAASFHHVDQALGLRFGGLKINWILELGGILCIAIAAARTIRAHQRPSKSAEPLGVSRSQRRMDFNQANK